MNLNYRDIVAILAIIFYTPALLASILLIHRHGFRQSWESWFVLATFSISRILYGSLELAASADPDAYGYRLAAATFAVDGLSPLLFAALGLLRRLRDLVAAKRVQEGRSPVLRVTSRQMNVLDLVITAAFICASVAYRGLSREEVESGIQHHSGTARAAAVLYVVAFVAIAAGAAVMFVCYRGEVEVGEMRVLVALVGSLPFLFVRLLYLVLDILGEVERFSAITGSVTIFLCMALLEEAVAAAWYLVVGFTVRVITRAETLAMREAEKKVVEGKMEEVGDVSMWERSRMKLDEEDSSGRAELDDRTRAELA